MTASELLFVPETHEYRTPDGVSVPSVTQILRGVGVSADFKAVAPGTLEYRRQLGTAVHADCHAYDDNDLDWATVDVRVKPYVEAWCQFREAKALRAIHRERRVFHAIRYYCGTLDGIFETPDGQRVLIDIKTGNPDDAAAHLQTAAYQAAYSLEHPGERITARWSVQLQPELRMPYRIHEYRDFHDFRTFEACVCVFHEQPARRRRIQ